MKKYLFIYKSEVMSNFQYIFNILASFISYAIFIFIFLNLWRYMYSNPSSLLNGYSMNQMIWYVIITELLWNISADKKYCHQIIDDVRGGNITYNINKPYSYIGYLLSTSLGASTIRFIIYSFLGILLGYIFLGSFPNLSFLSIIATIITAIFATAINTLFITFIGLFSFFIEDSNPFYWVYSKLILAFGTLFPLEFFPKIIRPLITYSPVYVVSYGPAKLFADFSVSAFGKVLIAQIIYLFISYLLCALLYRKGVRNLNVNGG